MLLVTRHIFYALHCCQVFSSIRRVAVVPNGLCFHIGLHFRRLPVQGQGETEVLVGFVTARCVHLASCDPADRSLLGLSSRLLDQERVVYILTLGAL